MLSSLSWNPERERDIDLAARPHDVSTLLGLLECFFKLAAERNPSPHPGQLKQVRFIVAFVAGSSR
jgi:hypothetical protein